MRKSPTEEQAKNLVKKFIEKLPSNCTACEMGEGFESAYLSFIDEHGLPLIMDNSALDQEKIYFCEVLLRKVSHKLIKKCNGRELVEKINYYYQHQPTHGAIILNEKRTRYLIVKSVHEKIGFPKGKVQGK